MIEIDYAKKSDLGGIISLFEETWGNTYREMIFEAKCYCIDLIENKFVFTAKDGGGLVGFSGFLLFDSGMGNLAYSDCRNIAKLNSAINSKRFSQEFMLQDIASFEFFNEECPYPTTSDMYNTALVVIPEYRRQGIGRRLTQTRIERAMDYGSKSIYVDCKEGSHSLELYRSFGFKPIVERKPYYPSGEGATFMVYGVNL